MAYKDLKGLDWERAVEWSCRDARDDFFVDPIRYNDCATRVGEYLDRNRHVLAEFSRDGAHYYCPIPKQFFLGRDAVFLPFSARLYYTAIFSEVYPVLASALEPSCYSYRRYDGVEDGSYPFPSTATTKAWLSFKNDFRKSVIDRDGGWVVMTDLSNFYSHISVARLVDRLQTLTPRKEKKRLTPLYEDLQRFLEHYSRQGWGIPQNYDPSSFFCSAFLTPVDRAFAHRGVHYFRWVDDIRIVTKSRAEAINVLQELERACRVEGLYLNSGKTLVVPVEDCRVQRELDVRHDVQLSNIETAIESRRQLELKNALEIAKLELGDCIAHGDDRMIRAYGNKVLDIAAFLPFREECVAFLRSLALERLKDMPGKADSWARMLSPSVDEEVQEALCEMLCDANFNRFSWTNMWMCVVLARATELSQKIRRMLLQMTDSYAQEPSVLSYVLLALMRSGDDVDRARLANQYLLPNWPCQVRRAVLIGAQELEVRARDSIFDGAVKGSSSLNELVKMLKGAARPVYTNFQLQNRQCVSEPKVVRRSESKLGIGLVNGAVIRFRLPRKHYSYE